MLSEKGEVKLADLGVAGELNFGQTSRQTMVGTPAMMAPEVLMSQKYDYKVDIWGIGMTTIEFARGATPTMNMNVLVNFFFSIFFQYFFFFFFLFVCLLKIF